jgi:phage terminase large subunit-like protein
MRPTVRPTRSASNTTTTAFKVLESVIQDDSWFAFIAAADEGDNWTDPAVWREANPNFGLSVKADDRTRKAEKAIALPGAQNAFGRMQTEPGARLHPDPKIV